MGNPTASDEPTHHSIRPDANGHRTRFSDSSVYDEICIDCGATDARGDNRLDYRCPGKQEDRHMAKTDFKPEYALGVDGPVKVADLEKHKFDTLPAPFKTLDQALMRGVSTGTAQDLLDHCATEYRKACKGVDDNAQIIDEQAEEIQRLESRIHEEATQLLAQMTDEQLAGVIMSRLDARLAQLKTQHYAQKPFDIVPPPGYFCYSHARSLLEAAMRFMATAALDDEAAATPTQK